MKRPARSIHQVITQAIMIQSLFFLIGAGILVFTPCPDFPKYFLILLFVALAFSGFYQVMQLRNNLSKTLTLIRHETQQIMDGNYKLHSLWTPYKEFNLLLIDFDAMRRKINQRESDLGDSERQIHQMFDELSHAQKIILDMNQRLEQMVSERTKHLEKALADLESAKDILVQTEKMAALGHMIAGIAHEINTPLGAISSSNENIQALLKHTITTMPSILLSLTEPQLTQFYTLYAKADRSLELKTSLMIRQKKKEIEQFFKDKQFETDLEMIENMADLNPDDGLAPYSDLFKAEKKCDAIRLLSQLLSMERSSAIITEASDRAAKVIGALRNTAYQDSGEKLRRVDLKGSLENVLTLFSSQIKSGINLQKTYQEIDLVLGYPDKLNQVWVNLISNALHAVNGKGTIEIRLTQNDSMVMVEIIDTGPGIPEDLKEKVFQPFFTTKNPGEGTGLGLDICRRIVEAHKGIIDFYCKDGKTSFIVKLPTAPKAW